MFRAPSLCGEGSLDGEGNQSWVNVTGLWEGVQAVYPSGCWGWWATSVLFGVLGGDRVEQAEREGAGSVAQEQMRKVRHRNSTSRSDPGLPGSRLCALDLCTGQLPTGGQR